MSGRAHDNTFFAKHRPVVLLFLVLIAVYVVAGAVHRLRTYDYTGDAVAAYETALGNSEAVGTLTQSESAGLIDNGELIHAKLVRLAKPGNKRFTPLFERLVAKTDARDDAAAPRTSECFLFPVVPLDGDSIKRIVGFTRFCFDDPRDLGRYSAVTAAITNR